MATHFARGKYRDEERIIAPAIEAIENSYDLLLALPERDSASFFRMEDHREAAEGDLPRAGSYLFSDAYNWLKFFWYTSTYKARQLTASLIYAYNTDNLLTWLVLGRSTLEYAAVSYYFVKQVKQLQLNGPDFAWSQLDAFENLMLQYAHGTRFNWPSLFAGDYEGLARGFSPTGSRKAVNVLTALSHLARRDARYKGVEIAYDMLSDFAHPNMASHAAVVEMPTAPAEMHECWMAAQPGPLRGEFVMVMSLPWVSMGIGTAIELFVEVTPLLQTWLKYVDDAAYVTIDLTK